jgi:hypothetical protein
MKKTLRYQAKVVFKAVKGMASSKVFTLLASITETKPVKCPSLGDTNVAI